MSGALDVPRVPAGTAVDEIEAQIRAAGCCVVERLAPESLLQQFETERGAYALGYYGDLRDPMEFLHGVHDRAPSFGIRD